MNESKPTYTVAYGEGENKKGEESYDTFKEAKTAYLSAVGDNLGQIVVLYEHLDGETSVVRYHDENDRKKEKDPEWSGSAWDLYRDRKAKIEKDLEVLEELTVLKDYYPPFKEFLKDMFAKGENEDLENLKEWLEE